MRNDFEIYSGQIMPVTNLPDLGASSNVVLRLTQMIPENKNFLVYFENWFASTRLFVTLAKKGVGALGTVRLNRFHKKGRGTFEEKETTFNGIDIRAVKWFDNRAVTLVSSFESAEPVETVTRYDSKSHREIEISCPRIVRTYNLFMGVSGQKNSTYQFIFRFVHVVIVTAWLLYRAVCKGHMIDKKSMMDLLEFRANIAKS
ncbi:hypothetical protein PR048_001410 [Dryococelus australis]|uniref:PiggyBac transposable element-derived protein domain-containing protein n=1 Tax=Dryococelus australis TaxID=614101 RepID=A0ABQ9IHA6_9NEOP|nr:hypothetical protein PR048_001410 [Dryococelus australis]